MKKYLMKLGALAAALLLAASAFGQGSQYYDHTTYPSQGSAGSSSAMRAELDLIEAGFGKLPTLAGNGGKITAVNSGGTAIEAVTTTGTGNAVRATSPTLVTPVLGTPSSGVATNLTGLPLSTGITGTLPVANGGTGVTSSTGSGSVVLSTSPTLVTPILGTPTSGDATNLTNTVAPQTHAASSKATPVDADELPLSDSAASFGLKRVTWANIKATLNGLFAASGANSDITALNGLSTSGPGLAPVGTILPFAGTSAPTGWLLVPTTQTNISRVTYAALFTAIGTTWGTGDGSTTFGMPWLAANYAPVQANSNVGTATVGQVIAHTHGFGTTNIAGAGASSALGAGNLANNTLQTDSAGGAANLAAGARVLYIVKY